VGLVSITVVGPTPEADHTLLLQHPPAHLAAAEALVASMNASVVAAPSDDTLAPLASWHILSHTADPLLCALWGKYGCQAYLRLRMPIVGGHAFEVFLFCRRAALTHEMQAVLTWGALGIWPQVKQQLAKAASPLSRRELQCLRLSFEGMTSRMIATHLGLGERTISFHIRNAIAKLKVNNRIEAVRKACLMGVL